MTEGSYAPLFDPDLNVQPFDEERTFRRGDEPPLAGYVYDQLGRIALAVNVALATGRPLLVRGKPGTGKSSLALDVARRLGWRYYDLPITSRTRARDLLWSFDAVRRLNDANVGVTHHSHTYITPGVLWWAFSPGTAATHGLSQEECIEYGVERLADPSPQPADRAVVLLDEIDKADPDVPNDLLVPIGIYRFEVVDVEQRATTIAAEAPPLVVITTNEERDLPRAFVRRCVVLTLPEPTADRMLEVAHAHFGDRVGDKLLNQVLTAYDAVRKARSSDTHEPSLAEFLDIVAAAISLNTAPKGDQRWKDIVEFTLRKPTPDTAS
jgi:MoxR-like ATPase